MENNFADWLRENLKERGWSQAELSRRSGVSTPQITRVLSGERGLGEQSILGFAQAFNLPPEDVFRAAGLLPPALESDPLAIEAAYLVGLLPEDQKRVAVDYIRFMVERNEVRGKKITKTK